MKDFVFSFHELFFYSRIEFWFCFKTCGSWGIRTPGTVIRTAV